VWQYELGKLIKYIDYFLWGWDLYKTSTRCPINKKLRASKAAVFQRYERVQRTWTLTLMLLIWKPEKGPTWTRNETGLGGRHAVDARS
jgi:hypothetical protein